MNKDFCFGGQFLLTLEGTKPPKMPNFVFGKGCTLRTNSQVHIREEQGQYELKASTKRVCLLKGSKGYIHFLLLCGTKVNQTRFKKST